jgi:Lrp/AsnC family transcriptional regulator, leucine-responsive regulatory protein
METFGPKVDLDDVNWRILVALQENARVSFSELGRRVGLTPPAVAERVRRLEEAGVITGYRAQLDVAKLGLPLSAIIRLAPRARDAREVGRLVRSLPEVLECHHVTGEDCYVLRVAFPSMGHLESLLEQLLRCGITTTSMVLSTPVTHRVVGPAIIGRDDDAIAS